MNYNEIYPPMDANTVTPQTFLSEIMNRFDTENQRYADIDKRLHRLGIKIANDAPPETLDAMVKQVAIKIPDGILLKLHSMVDQLERTNNNLVTTVLKLENLI